MKEVGIEVLGKEDVINLIGKQWMLITAGTRESFNTMTASWGAIGNLWNKPVAFVFVRPERYTYEFIENDVPVTLSFYEEQYRDALKTCGSKSGRDCDKVALAGLTPTVLDNGSVSFDESRLTFQCRKLFRTELQDCNFIDKSLLERWYGAHGGLHTMYVLEIEKVYTK